jgi:hypothetical protein
MRRRAPDSETAAEIEIGSPINPKWVRLAKYCELTGETRSAVHNRRYTNQWKDGEHTYIDPSHRTWVNLEAAEAWMRAGCSLGATALQATRAQQRADLRARASTRKTPPAKRRKTPIK